MLSLGAGCRSARFGGAVLARADLADFLSCRAETGPSLAPPATSKARYLRDRFNVIKQVILRNEHFSPPTLVGQERQDYMKVRESRRYHWVEVDFSHLSVTAHFHQELARSTRRPLPHLRSAHSHGRRSSLPRRLGRQGRAGSLGSCELLSRPQRPTERLILAIADARVWSLHRRLLRPR